MNECLSDGFGDDVDGPSVSTTKIRVARKSHKCGECGREIKPGKKYEHVSGCWEGTWDVFKTCIGCRNARRNHICGGYL